MLLVLFFCSRFSFCSAYLAHTRKSHTVYRNFQLKNINVYTAFEIIKYYDVRTLRRPQFYRFPNKYAAVTISNHRALPLRRCMNSTRESTAEGFYAAAVIFNLCLKMTNGNINSDVSWVSTSGRNAFEARRTLFSRGYLLELLAASGSLILHAPPP